MTRWFKTDLSQLEKVSNQRIRGREFETYLYGLFYNGGFSVQRNPGTARPRQTDLIAKHRGQTLLIEAKWVARPIGTPEIDALRSRLDRVPSDIIGCFVSMSDYSDAALREVERNRTREILLINRVELEAIQHGRLDLRDLINTKRDKLRDEGKVWLREQDRKRSRAKSSFPLSDELLDDGVRRRSTFAFQSDSTTLFTREILQFDPSGTPGQTGVELQLTPEFEGLGELSDFFSQLVKTLELEGGGAFSIHNPGKPNFGWHGVGLTTFLDEVENAKQRYALVHQDYSHRRESLTYLAPCKGGFLHFEGQQDLELNTFWQSEFTIYLPGIPVNLEPFIRLCERSGSPFATFNPVNHDDRLGEIHRRVYLKTPIPLDVIGRVLSQRFRDLRNEDERFSVSGIVARNPFYEKKGDVERLLGKSRLFRDFALSETLIFSLKDWLGVDDKVDRFEMTRVDSNWMGGNHMLRPVCTWGEILHRGRRHRRLLAASSPLDDASKNRGLRRHVSRKQTT
ncbi:restriction endonuclease [Corallococcus exiguus]|nr:restriction endonuclease [Corallococcus exiguus]